MKRYLPLLIIIFVFVISAGGALLLYRLKQQRFTVAQAASKPEGTASSGEPGAQSPHVRGPAEAPVTLEEFGDFECRPCGDLSPILDKVEEDYAGRLRMIFRQFPLAVHKHASEAARAAEAAGLQGRFWEMHDLLYRNRFLWPRAPDVLGAFTEYAKTLGLDVERFKHDMESEQVTARITADQRRGTSLGVDRTPALFIQNRRIPSNALNPPGLRALIDDALKAKPESK